MPGVPAGPGPCWATSGGWLVEALNQGGFPVKKWWFYQSKNVFPVKHCGFTNQVFFLWKMVVYQSKNDFSVNNGGFTMFYQSKWCCHPGLNQPKWWSGWWFGTFGLYIFHNIYGIILPIDERICFKMVKTSNQRVLKCLSVVRWSYPYLSHGSANITSWRMVFRLNMSDWFPLLWLRPVGHSELHTTYHIRFYRGWLGLLDSIPLHL
jgi:hypothetical protein